VLTNSFLIFFLIITFLCILLLSAGIIWLFFAHQAHKKNFQRLNERINNYQSDLSGLCSAALLIDKQLENITEYVNEQLTLIDSKLVEITQHPSPEINNHPYQSVIQKVKAGANISELMQSAGLSHDEAALLIRLHSKK
jgi:hypothetical protein